MKKGLATISRLAAGALFAALLLLVGLRPAFAAGSVKPESATLEEVEGQWKLKLVIDYGSIPEQQYIPVLFSFEPVVLYERSYTDEGGDKPVLTKKNLINQPEINIDQVIGFSDGTGKLFKGTKFNFVIRRDRGFEAGEYQVSIKKSDGGAALGQKFRITLKGDNPVIDRRAISFVGEKPKKKEDKPKNKPASDVPAEGEPTGEPPADGSGAPSAEPPPAVEPKQGGCGCETVGEPAPSGYLLGLAGLGLGVVFGRRRSSRLAARL